MTTNWVPPQISEICPEQNAPLTQCSQTGFIFLTLLAQLLGGSIDNRIYPKSNPYSFGAYNDLPSSVRDTSGGSYSAFVGTSPAIETSVLGPQLQSANNDVKNIGIESVTPGLGPVIEPGFDDIKTAVHVEGPKGIYGFMETLFTHPKKNLNFENLYSEYSAAPTNFDSFLNRKGFYDAIAADSKRVTVKTESKKEGKSRKKRQAVEEFDFIIVGAGSAGCVLANRLSEVKKWKILLLEAGPEEPDVTSVPAFAPALGRSSIDWMYRTQPEALTCRAQRGQTCAWISGRVMGGSSSINYLVYMRGNKRDYDDWAALGNIGWSYREVLPYFKKSENNRDLEAHDTYFHGVKGPMTVERFSYADKNIITLLEAFQETGLPLVDFNGRQQIGTMTTQTTSQDGTRVSTNRAFIRHIRKNRPNLIIETNAQVTKILIERNKKIAYGVKYIKNGIWYKVHAKKEVILSAGGLNSPKLLMLSGIGIKHDLQALNIPVIQHLKVGYNLQDHVTTDAMLMSLTNKTSTAICNKELLKEVKHHLGSKYKDGPLAATGPLHISAFIRTEYADEDETVPDIQFHFDGRNLEEFYSDPTTYLATNVLPLAYYNSINVRPVLLLPKSRGFLTLNKTDPVFGQPLIYPRFFTVQHDIDTLVAALNFAVTLENTEAFIENGIKFVRKPVKGCSIFEWGTYNYFACLFTSYTTTIFHPSGTCKMGPSFDEDAVVNSRLKVYGVSHLRVADASIMPNIVRGNTNAACIMIGEKAADIIKEDWGHYI